MIEPWRKLYSKALGDFRVFTVRSDRKVSPRTGEEHDFFILDAVNWVNVIALAPEGQIVLIEQYRHGSNSVELEIPGGVMDPHDASPVATGIRELREETGFEGENARVIGTVLSNPAIMSNTCYTVLIENCRKTCDVEFDPSEDVVTRLTAVERLPELVQGGKIMHSLVVAALYHFELWQRQQSSAANQGAFHAERRRGGEGRS